MYLKLEDIAEDNQQIIKIGGKQYNIDISGGVPNGYLIEDRLNGFNWKIVVNEWSTDKIWKRGSDEDCDLYANVVVTVDDVLNGNEVEVVMIDGTVKVFNMKVYDYRKRVEVKNNGLKKFETKRRYKNRGIAFIDFNIMYSTLSDGDRKRLEEFLQSNDRWKYRDEL